MRWGDRVEWIYEHSLNAISKTLIKKRGIYHSRARHTSKHWNKPGAKQMAYVLFEGNKRESLVALHELKDLTAKPMAKPEARKHTCGVDCGVPMKAEMFKHAPAPLAATRAHPDAHVFGKYFPHGWFACRVKGQIRWFPCDDWVGKAPLRESMDAL